ncbi:unnamed protein product [Cyclocybe aegerita]|uniref:Uncharacterized protein n=1 Tax=Cyclocybe aegerita TaxID=1973307 RepID=A0A8S0WYE3_CYCAE|nr:unnamed protein product [Cyclocybe aegerita]
MADPFPITEAQLTGLFVESILFGVHMVSLGYCLQALMSTKTRWRRSSEINWPMVAISCALFANAAFDVSLGFYHNMKAFVFYTGPGGAAAKFTDISNWVNVLKSLTVVVQTMIGDAMLIYRCWVVYHQSFLVVSCSIVLWLGCLATTIWVIYLEATLHSRVLVSASQLQPAGTSFWALTIVLNIITTGLLLWRIHSVESSNRKYRIHSITDPDRRRSTLQRVMLSIIESGILYSIASLTTFITFVIGSNAVYVTTDAEIQIVGIAFNLIIIRASNIAGFGDGSTMVSAQTSATQSAPLQIIHGSQMTRDQKTEVHVLVTQDSKQDYENMKDS